VGLGGKFGAHIIGGVFFPMAANFLGECEYGTGKGDHGNG
jgi:hypothetical protein